MTPRRLVAVFGSSAAGEADAVYQDGLLLGRLLAASGHDVATGGYGGTMEAVSRGADEGGSRVVGVVAPTVFPHRPGANRWVHEEVRAGSITERIHLLLSMADATIALPGSVGTATELVVAWNLNHVADASGRPLLVHVAVGEHWRPLVDLLVERYGADAHHVRLVSDVASAVDALDPR